MIVRFEISAVPTSINAQKIPAIIKGKARLIKSPAYRTWIAKTELELKNQRGFATNDQGKVDDFLWASEILFPCNQSKMDVDNVPKAIHDILVKAHKVPDDRYLADSRVRWSNGDKIIVTIQKEELSKWTEIKKLSKALIKRLAHHTG